MIIVIIFPLISWNQYFFYNGIFYGKIFHNSYFRPYFNLSFFVFCLTCFLLVQSVKYIHSKELHVAIIKKKYSLDNYPYSYGSIITTWNFYCIQTKRKNADKAKQARLLINAILSFWW